MVDVYSLMILQYMNNKSSTDFNFREPHIKPSIKYVYPLFLLLHAIVCLVGIVGNITMIVVIIRRRLYQDQTFILFMNLAFADLIKCVFAMPLTFANLVIQNWLFGSFLCFFVPMLQNFPIHATMLTFLTIAIDR
ncbi:neuropeptide y receptor type 1 [Plakobranchus ocellatus]|uniref:Neuropeptide y receptor type 1 n=1 Tax=Plakobranchus ocellatus TaxID=259542 RepID=A0AAV4BZZ3_9GAST|nr:neuropeptide y receptor type 1 [Plakobranchus ocellatus]